MTDLEMTRLCAEAMGYRVDEVDEERGLWCHLPAQHGVWYHPILNDAQAMALVKRFKLEPRFNDGNWLVTESYKTEPHARNTDLNRAIVECVARMQGGKGE